MDHVKDFLDYETFKFWIAVVVVILIHLIPITSGEEDITMILFRAMWQETRSFYFLLGMVAVEFVIIIVPFVIVQKFLHDELNFS